eukprot:1903647-Amphidinium_carterae.1
MGKNRFGVHNTKLRFVVSSAAPFLSGWCARLPNRFSALNSASLENDTLAAPQLDEKQHARAKAMRSLLSCSHLQMMHAGTQVATSRAKSLTHIENNGIQSLRFWRAKLLRSPAQVQSQR